MHCALTTRRTQRGIATLAVTLALLAAMLITLLAANRQLLLELRQSANQADATAAFEAAEAGLDWAVAMLNADARVGGDCRPSPLATQSFRERLREATPASLQPACVRGETGWACSCAVDSTATPMHGGATFALQFAAGPAAGQLHVTATGCPRAAGACPLDGARSASARHEVLLTLQPAMAAPPPTALTQRPAHLAPERFFAGLFGLSKAEWRHQPAVHQLACRGDCGAELAVQAAQGATLFWLPGDLRLRGPLALGTPQRPLLIVAEGQVRLEGDVSLHGVVYAAELGWSGPASVVRGALISEGGAAGDPLLDLAHDAALLEALRTRDGSFVRRPGSWRDF